MQGVLIRRIIPLLGEVKTTIWGFVLSIAGLIGLAFASEGWMVYALMPVTALGAIITPAMTGLMANQIPDDSQGELQGALSSVMGITLIISPVMMTQLFGHFTKAGAAPYFPGRAVSRRRDPHGPGADTVLDWPAPHAGGS